MLFPILMNDSLDRLKIIFSFRNINIDGSLQKLKVLASFNNFRSTDMMSPLKSLLGTSSHIIIYILHQRSLNGSEFKLPSGNSQTQCRITFTVSISTTRDRFLTFLRFILRFAFFWSSQCCSLFFSPALSFLFQFHFKRRVAWRFKEKNKILSKKLVGVKTVLILVATLRNSRVDCRLKVLSMMI